MTTFDYLSVFISIVIGLAVVHLLGGLVSTVDREGGRRYWVHTVWVAYWVLWLPYFWWFTFDWRHLETWTFPVFFLVVFYAMLVYVVTVVLMPSSASEVDDFEVYFYRNRRRFFLLFALLHLVDVADAIVKPGNLDQMGSSYLPVMAFVLIGNLIASSTDSRRYHGGWVATYIVVILGFGFGLWVDVFGRA